MPQARPPKRPSDAGDVLPDDVSAPKLKLARLERGPEDFSNVVKNKLQSYTRTGQACDRCKVRAHRDGGCPPALAGRLPSSAFLFLSPAPRLPFVIDGWCRDQARY